MFYALSRKRHASDKCVGGGVNALECMPLGQFPVTQSLHRCLLTHRDCCIYHLRTRTFFLSLCLTHIDSSQHFRNQRPMQRRRCVWPRETMSVKIIKQHVVSKGAERLFELVAAWSKQSYLPGAPVTLQYYVSLLSLWLSFSILLSNNNSFDSMLRWLILFNDQFCTIITFSSVGRWSYFEYR